MSMLYQFYEAQRALLSPLAEFSSASSKLYSHPLSPFTHTPMAPRVSAGLNLMHRLSKEYEKPEFNIHTVKVDDVDVAVQQQVTIEKPFCRLLRFKRFTDDFFIGEGAVDLGGVDERHTGFLDGVAQDGEHVVAVAGVGAVAHGHSHGAQADCRYPQSLSEGPCVH